MALLTYPLTLLQPYFLNNSLSFAFMVTNVYGPTLGDRKLEFLQELRIIGCMHDLPWVLLGDFNMLRDPDETTVANLNLQYMTDFNQLISDLNMNELPLIGRTYTWSNKCSAPSFSKLDRTLLSSHWAMLTTHAPYLIDLSVTTSDHIPLLLRFKKIDGTQSRSYRFEKFWFMSDETREIILRAWHSVQLIPNIALNIIKKFNKVRKEIMAWEKTKFRGTKTLMQRTKHIIRILDIAEESRNLNNS
jgi:hypothetical protein